MTLRKAIGDWITDAQAATGPRYLAIANAIGAAMDRGALAPGDRLPPHRALAAALGVDLTTVTRAYAEARRRGLVDSTVGSGTFIRAAPDGEVAQISVDMSMNIPPAPADVSLRASLRDGLSRTLRGADVATLMAYRAGAGTREERAAGAAWLAPSCGGTLPASRVLLASGAQSAMLAIAGILVRRGDRVATEAMTYPGFRALAAHLGLTLVPVAGDAEGMRPDALDAVCRDGVKAIYCTPSIQNPTTATMGRGRRGDIVAVARRHELPVIEDGAYDLYPHDPAPSLCALAPERVYHVATTAKALSPGLRLAYIVVPEGAQGALIAAIRDDDIGDDGLAAAGQPGDGLDPRWHGAGDPGRHPRRGGGAPGAGGAPSAARRFSGASRGLASVADAAAALVGAGVLRLCARPGPGAGAGGCVSRRRRAGAQRRAHGAGCGGRSCAAGGRPARRRDRDADGAGNGLRPYRLMGFAHIV
jgi:DNA-binding transcriptional MocR family regulator